MVNNAFGRRVGTADSASFGSGSRSHESPNRFAAYGKTSGTCAEPNHIATCPLPTHQLRNGHLNQMAYSFALFIRDIADGDLISWIDDQIGQT